MTDGHKKGVPKPQSRFNIPEEEEDEEEEVGGPTLESQFAAFVQHKNPDDPGTHITLTQIDQWMRQAGVIQVRKLTRTDTGVCYFHFKKYKLDFDEFKEFLDLLANRKGLTVQGIVEKLVTCGLPQGEDK